jgi:hypothetical protein
MGLIREVYTSRELDVLEDRVRGWLFLCISCMYSIHNMDRSSPNPDSTEATSRLRRFDRPLTYPGPRDPRVPQGFATLPRAQSLRASL